MKSKSDYLWFFSSVGMTCVSAFIYSETGKAFDAFSAVGGFLSYSLLTVGYYRRSAIQRRLGK